MNNLDFDKLIELVDSVKTIEPPAINDLFHTNGYYWQTNNGTQIVLINDNNEELQIESRKISQRLPPFYFPWIITLNGVHAKNRAIEINRFLKAVYPNLLGYGSKVKTIQFLVKELYIRQKLGMN